MTEHVEAGDPRYAGFRVTDLWAFTSVDPDDDQEGILGFGLPPIPLLASDARRLAHLWPIARELQRVLQRPVTLKHFALVDEEPVA